MSVSDKAQASLCICADSPEPWLPVHEILILITLSSDYTCTNVQTHQCLSCWYEKHTNRHLSSMWNFGTVTKTMVSLCKWADSPEPSQLEIALTRHLSQHEIFELWRRLELYQANVWTRHSLLCSHKKRDLSQRMRFWFSDKSSSENQMCRLARAFAIRMDETKFAFWASTLQHGWGRGHMFPCSKYRNLTMTRW